MCGVTVDFNPRPREEGDPRRLLVAIQVDISIHALVKRATVLVFGFVMRFFISIHALVKRATKFIVEFVV